MIHHASRITHHASLAWPIICLVTDRTLVGGPLEDAVGEAVAGGVNLVQLREKDLATRELLDLAVRLRKAIAGRAVLVVNGRADVAFAAGAAGVHLPADGLPSEGARAALTPAAIVGRSVHSVEEVHQHAHEALDYLELGTIFPSRSHPRGIVIGSGAIAAVSDSRVPVIGIGGITPENAGKVMAAGAHGVAVISAILASADARQAAERLSEAVREGWSRRGVTHHSWAMGHAADGER